LLFHRWNPEAVEEKAKAAKNSRSKKTDDIESYVYRNEAGELCIPGEYLRQAIIHAAKYRQDPRSTRKSAMDLYKAGVQSLTPLASLGLEKWDYEDKRRVVIQRSAVNRVRPAMKAGWKATFELMVGLPEYIHPNDLRDVITNAGRLVGLGDFRPTYGRFAISQIGVI
jgi:archaeosine-15-forming tRNA-guanine transglycosylase